MKPFVIPFFLSHQGCPHRCLYCDQHSTGGRRAEPVTADSVVRGIEAGLASARLRPGTKVEVAFFGGTFTMLPPARQEALLDAAGPFLKAGLVSGLRLSTRPDALLKDQVLFLKEKGVKTVEIGAQSLDDRVLEASRRGHTAHQTVQAAGRIRDAGLALVLQLLPGLPAEDDASREKTLMTTLDLAPEETRIYPLLVIEGTILAQLYRQGEYQPLSLDRAISICARFYLKFNQAGIRVIRLGLQPGPDLEKSCLAGPYHPAFGHLVRSALFARALKRAIRERPYQEKHSVAPPPVVHVSPTDISAALGDRRKNLEHLAAFFNLPDLSIKADPQMARGFFAWQNRLASVFQVDDHTDENNNEDGITFPHG